MSADTRPFTQQGIMTDPAGYGPLFDDLPRDAASLVKVVQGLLIHIFWAERYGCPLTEERKSEVQIRPVGEKLARIVELDPSPLDVPRPLERRLVGNCRDFSVLLTSLLRHAGVPARARCGFGRYFLPGHHEDHWVCEYWNADRERWVLADAQLDALQCGVLQVPFDPLDVPRDQFVTGGKAWLLCRRGEADPDTFGIFDMKGLWFVRGDFLRDVASLNGVELLPWDSWGLIERTDDMLTPEDLSLLDRAAELSEGDVPAFGELRRLYESEPRLRVPPVIRSYVQGRAREIAIRGV